MRITEDIKYVGVNDHTIDLFEGQYQVPHGMAYNSYVVEDEKIAVLDTVDVHFTEEWLYNIARVLEGRKPEYLVVQHMEPDHSASITNFLDKYPDTKVVANQKAFAMMNQFFDVDLEGRKVIVENGDTLSLGSHELMFIFAPMVHWPEVMVTYEKKDKVLFSSDGFGKFGALDAEEAWDDEARRYYFGICGKYGAQVQALLKKIAELDVKFICSLHGPVLKENLEHYINLYNTWSSYQVESEGVMIAYASIYGNTKKAVELLVENLKKKGCQKVVVYDLARTDKIQAMADAFRYGKLVLAASTYNGTVFPAMKEFIQHMTERSYKNRTVGLIENGSWAPVAAKTMKDMFSESKNITWLDTVVRIKSALKPDNVEQIQLMADELV